MRDQHRTDLVLVEPETESLEQARPVAEQLMDDLLAIEVMAKGGRPIGLARTASIHLCSTSCCCVPWPLA